MSLFGRTNTPRVVVKEYGRDSFLGLISPLLTLVLLAARGPRPSSGPPPRVLDKMEKDARAMAARGYRVVASDEYEQPAFGISYVKVTYELVSPPDRPGDPP
jgi:hypothetical protein